MTRESGGRGGLVGASVHKYNIVCNKAYLNDPVQQSVGQYLVHEVPQLLLLLLLHPLDSFAATCPPHKTEPRPVRSFMGHRYLTIEKSSI